MLYEYIINDLSNQINWYLTGEEFADLGNIDRDKFNKLLHLREASAEQGIEGQSRHCVTSCVVCSR